MEEKKTSHHYTPPGGRHTTLSTFSYETRLRSLFFIRLFLRASASVHRNRAFTTFFRKKKPRSRSENAVSLNKQTSDDYCALPVDSFGACDLVRPGLSATFSRIAAPPRRAKHVSCLQAESEMFYIAKRETQLLTGGQPWRT